MASGSPHRILRGPGRLVANPTDLGLSFPFGGVEVGLSNQFQVTSEGSPLRIPCEGLGSYSNVLEPAESYFAGCFLRGWDDDAVRYLFAGHQSQGATSSHRSFRVPGSVQPGASALPRAVSLLFVPDNALDVPAMLAYRAVCFWTEAQQILWQRQEELGIPLIAQFFRDESDRVLAIERLSDLTL